MSLRNLYGFSLQKQNDFIEIGGGFGELSNLLIKSGFSIKLFIEPDHEKFRHSRQLLKNVNCLKIDISNLDPSQIKPSSNNVTIILQDVIEHIPKDKLKLFLDVISYKYKNINLIGRTPNLKSPFGLRNSFGDNTHIHRFTNISLNQFLKDLGFSNNLVKSEPYLITGLTSFIRYFFYLFVLSLVSIGFLIVYGNWEGFLTPNIVFNSKRFKEI